MKPGEIYWADLPTGRRPVIVVSREDLNRGNYIVAVLCTTAQFSVRSGLPSCVALYSGEFGLPSDCVAQCEAITFLDQGDVDVQSGIVGVLDEIRLRDIVKAIGHVISQTASRFEMTKLDGAGR